MTNASFLQRTPALYGTSNHSHAVEMLDTPPGDPPTFADNEVMRAKINEVILKGRR